MNGAHDLGGMHGFGPIGADPDEPLFHAEWERKCFALTLAAGFTGEWNIDASRFAREQMPPAEYLATGYYEHWLFGLNGLSSSCCSTTRLRAATDFSLRRCLRLSAS